MVFYGMFMYGVLCAYMVLEYGMALPFIKWNETLSSLEEYSWHSIPIKRDCHLLSILQKYASWTFIIYHKLSDHNEETNTTVIKMYFW